MRRIIKLSGSSACGESWTITATLDQGETATVVVPFNEASEIIDEFGRGVPAYIKGGQMVFVPLAPEDIKQS